MEADDLTAFDYVVTVPIPTDMPTNTPTPTCSQSGACFTVELMSPVYESGRATLTFRVTNKCSHDVSFVAFGTNAWARLAPLDGTTYQGSLGAYRVVYTDESGNPGFTSIKFEYLGDGFEGGAREEFRITLGASDLAQALLVLGKANGVEDSFCFLANLAPGQCQCELPTPTATTKTKLPDLTVGGVWQGGEEEIAAAAVQEAPQPSEPATTAAFTIVNLGEGAAPSFWVAAYVDRATAPSEGEAADLYWQVPELQPGAQVVLSLAEPAEGQLNLAPGVHSVWVLANSGHGAEAPIVEADRSNNLFGPFQFEMLGPPTATPTATTATVEATPTPAETPSATPTPTEPAADRPTPTPTAIPAATVEPTPTDTATATVEPTPTDTATATVEPTPTETATPVPTDTPAPPPTDTPTPEPSPTEPPTDTPAATDTPTPEPPPPTPTDTPTTEPAQAGG